MKIQQRKPEYVNGEPVQSEINSLDELYNVEWIKWSTGMKTHHSICYSESSFEGGYGHIMAMYNFKEEYYGCTGWFVIGFVTEGSLKDLGLKNWLDVKGHHLSHCEYLTIPRGGHGSPCTCGFSL